MKRLHLSEYSRIVSIEERLQFAKMSREQALLLPDEMKLRYFFSFQVSHRKLDVVEAGILHHLGPYSDARILTLIGPPGAGKTSFAENVLARRMKPASPGLRPFLFLAAPAYGSIAVPWSGVYRKILQAGDEPLIEHKRGTVIEGNRVKTLSPSAKTLDTLRAAVESMLLHRQTRLLAIDEVLHILRFRDEEALMDTLKSLADSTDSQLLLIGSYDLFDLVRSYAQVGRRSEVFYLDRYRRHIINGKAGLCENEDDIREFTHIIERLQKRWPFEWVPNFVAVAVYLLDATLGIVGLLKDFMFQCLVHQMTNGGKWSSSYVRKSLKSTAVMKGIREEFEKGEKRIYEEGFGQFSIEESVLDAIGSGLEMAR
jgi:hypothetical protein